MNIDQLIKRGGNELYINSNIDIGIDDITVGSFGLLNRSILYRVSNSLPQYPFAVTAWKSVVGSLGHEVILNSKASEESKGKIKQKVYKLLYTDLLFKDVVDRIIEFIAREGNAIVRYDKRQKKILVHSRFKYKIRHNEELDITTYTFLDKHSMEVVGLTNLIHGKNVYHIKHPAFKSLPISPSPIDAAQRYIALENNGVTANEKLFKNSFIGTMLMSFSEEMMGHIQAKKDTDGKNWFERTMEKLRDTLAGVSKAFQIGYIPGLQNIFHLDKNNEDTQFYQLIKELTPERVAWAYSMVLANFGTGNNLTYNNAGTFDDALYGKIGKFLEEELDALVNDFLLPVVGVITTENFYFKYIKPKKQTELNLLIEAREQFKVQAITKNEYRQMLGRDPMDQETVPEQKPLEKGDKQGENDFFLDGVRKSVYKTNSEKSIETPAYEKFNQRLEKAIRSQVEEYAARIQTNGIKSEIKPLETFYSFPALKKDLLEFAGIGIDTVRKDKRTSFSAKKLYFDGEYPSYVLEYVDQRIEALLKGSTSFASVDKETAAQIATVIEENINEGTDTIAKLILEKVDEFASYRARLIARTEVANAVEATRYLMYTNDDQFSDGGKEWLTSMDDRVRRPHSMNAMQKIIKIKEAFSNGNMRAGEDINCRCDTVYYSNDEVSW